MKKRIFSAALVVILLFSALPCVLAVSGAQGVADAANNYLERDYAVGSYFGGGSENWCGRFLYRCAQDAGETGALCGSVDTMKSTNAAMAWFAKNASSVGYFYDQITLSNYGLNTSNKVGKANYSPKVGDIIFYDWDGKHDNLGHMEVVVSVSGNSVSTIGGSTGGSCKIKSWNGVYHVHKHSYDISSSYIVAYARPNYGGSGSSGSTASGGSVSSTHSTLRNGSKGEEVKELQRKLNAVSSAGLDVDGGFGAKTLAAVKAYQSAKGLVVDGVVGTNTWAALDADYDRVQTPTPAPQPDSTLKIAPTTSPTTGMTAGAPFYFRGSITSNYSIISATVSILNASGAVVQSKTVNPNKTSVDILNDGLDSLKFGTLATGSYTLKLTATDSYGKTAEWTCPFSIGSAPAPVPTPAPTPAPTPTPAASTLRIAPTTHPSMGMAVGSPFYFRGSITSNYNITMAEVSILDANGTVVQTKKVHPNKKSVDILNDGLDSLKFGALTSGSYMLTLYAADSSGAMERYEYPFSIVGAPNPEPAPVPTPAPAPTPVQAPAVISTQGLAYASEQMVEIDGNSVWFPMYALLDGNGNMVNYIKLRDLAAMLSRTRSKFRVTWDGQVNLKTGYAYTANGTEFDTPYSGNRQYTSVNSPTVINGAEVSLEAFVITDDAGGGYTYYKLRDLGKALRFNVGWSADRGVYIETGKAYDPNN